MTTTTKNQSISLNGITLYAVRESGTRRGPYLSQFEDDHSNVETLAIADCLAVIEDALGDQAMQPVFKYSPSRRDFRVFKYNPHLEVDDCLTLTDEQAARMSWTDKRTIRINSKILNVQSKQTLTDTAACDDENNPRGEFMRGDAVSVKILTLDKRDDTMWTKQRTFYGFTPDATTFDVGFTTTTDFETHRYHGGHPIKGMVEVGGIDYAPVVSNVVEVRARIDVYYDHGSESKSYEFTSMADLKAQSKKIAKFIANKSAAFTANGRGSFAPPHPEQQINAMIRQTLELDEHRAALASGQHQMDYAIKTLGDGETTKKRYGTPATNWEDWESPAGTFADAGERDDCSFTFNAQVSAVWTHNVWTLATPIGFVRFDARITCGKLYANFSISKDTSGMNEATLCGGPDTSYTTKEFIALVKQADRFVRNLLEDIDHNED